MTTTFEWDTVKEQANLKKHGIDFEIACLVFNNPNRIEFFDAAHSTFDEDRYITIGFVGEVLTVVYTIRNEMIRIISARVATKKEKEAYYGA